VLNLEIQNKALLMKQLHKFYSKADVPWVHLVWALYGDNVPHASSKRGSFWWRDIFSLVEDYRSVSRCRIGNGQSVLFWKDFWVNGELLCDKYPRLFSYCLNEDISVATFASSQDAAGIFALPLSVEAYQEFQEVSVLMNSTEIIDEQNDVRSFVWGDKYTPSKFYNFLFAQVPQDAALNAIWASKAMPKLKVFLWTLMLDRLNTRDIMLRKNWNLDSGPNCCLCHVSQLETRDHLFFQCEFAATCWDSIGILWSATDDFTARFITARNTFPGPCFLEIMACACWNIWKVRNELIFEGRPCSFNRWKVGFRSDLFLHKFRVKTAFVQPLVDWLLQVF
jgi:hypothetical protein